MSDGTFRNEDVSATLVTHPNWGAIWGGVFTFATIWSIFGLLGMGVFASAANASAAHPVTGMSVGEAIWLVVLTIISMFVAGTVTGRLASVGNARDGAVHGMIMFGLSVVSGVVILGLITTGTAAAASGGAVVGGSQSPYMLRLFTDIGWIGFVALLLGWLAAMSGASMGVRRRQEVVSVRETRQQHAA